MAACTQAVRLSGDGQYVEIVSSAGAANSIVVRYTIPDAPHGGGINSTISVYVDGVFAASLKVTSRFSWSYGFWQIPYSKVR
jgi:hypothetical protein